MHEVEAIGVSFEREADPQVVGNNRKRKQEMESLEWVNVLAKQVL